jgi:pimeloyl-ACP methyl ester carboxylesterase
MANGLKINYYRTGGDKPAVVLLHGLSDYGLCWTRLPLFLEPSYDVVMVDLRGHGMSEKPENGYRAEDMADDVYWVIRTLSLSQPVVIGHSMGASVAAVFARHNPKQVSGVVLEDPPWQIIDGSDKNTTDRLTQEDFIARMQYLKSKSLEEIIAIGLAENPSWDETEFKQWAKGKQMVSLHAANWLTTQQTPWQEIVSALKVPGLLITSDIERGAIVTPQVGNLVSQSWKAGEVVSLPGAGHNIHREQYYKFRDVVKLFLRRYL